MPRYCRACVLPETRPGVHLDAAGVCNGCRNAEAKRHIDWTARRAAFADLVARAKRAGAPYDCLIPVSGGKDSYWQVVTCLEHGLRPLCMTYVSAGRTELGEANLQSLLAIGVDHMALRVDPQVERRFVAAAFRKTAISGLVTHMGVYAAPVSLALRLQIPLVVYGENTAFEYGTADQSLIGATVDRRWLREFGVTAGTTAADWISDSLTRADLTAYFLPPEDEVAASGMQVVFLGWFFPWDPEHSHRIARAHGFRPRAAGARVGHWNFANIDDEFIAVHHHPKWHKFGITRSWDTLSVEIRFGRRTRGEAIELLRSRGDETPVGDIPRFCSYVGISVAEYHAILEGFRNRAIWSRRDGRWVIDGFLIDDFAWPADVVEAAPE